MYRIHRKVAKNPGKIKEQFLNDSYMENNHFVNEINKLIMI